MGGERKEGEQGERTKMKRGGDEKDEGEERGKEGRRMEEK